MSESIIQVADKQAAIKNGIIKIKGSDSGKTVCFRPPCLRKSEIRRYSNAGCFTAGPGERGISNPVLTFRVVTKPVSGFSLGLLLKPVFTTTHTRMIFPGHQILVRGTLRFTGSLQPGGFCRYREYLCHSQITWQ